MELLEYITDFVVSESAHCVSCKYPTLVLCTYPYRLSAHMIIVAGWRACTPCLAQINGPSYTEDRVGHLSPQNK